MLTEREYRPVTHFALAGGDRTRSGGAIELVLCFRVEVIGALGLASRGFLGLPGALQAIRAEIETAVDRSRLRRSCGATLTAALVQPLSIGFTGKPA